VTAVDQIAQLNAALSGRYEIEGELGAGGMATVYLARDLRHGRKVAVKVLREDLTASLGVDRFLREIQIAAGLNHPHILPLHDSGEAAGRLFYVMPYVEGESLRQTLDNGGEMPIADGVRALRDVADAIAYAHKHGVVHRDIKPENVMVSGRHALVTDFGVAKAVRDAAEGKNLTTVGLTLGTPAYMSPEQATADPSADYRGDIYSFGVLAYELLTGSPPFTGDSHQEVLAAHVVTPPPSVSLKRGGIPPPLTALIMKCLEKNPADRWQSADELVPQLEALLTPSGGIIPSDAYAAPPASPANARQSFFSRRLLLAAVSLFALVALGSFVAWRRSQTSDRPSGMNRLAVLPFDNLGQADDEYFVAGLADEITDHLATIPGLAVVSRSSASKYRKTTKSAKQIGEELGVDYLVQGSVRWERSPNGTSRVRVSPQLVRVSDDEQLWTDSFDKVLASVFDVQTQVAEGVADALNITLAETVRRSLAAKLTSNLDAYDAYLRGNEIVSRLTYNHWDAALAALKFYEKAVALDPKFAAAYARMSGIHMMLSKTGYDLSVTHLPGAERQVKVKTNAELAVKLRPDLAEGHVALGVYYQNYDDPRARDEYALALRLEPSNADALVGLAVLQPTPRDGLPYAQRAARLDPRSANLASALGEQYNDAHQFADAERSYDRAIALVPGEPNYYLLKATNDIDAGNAIKGCATMRAGTAVAGIQKMIVLAAREPIFSILLRICSHDFENGVRSIGPEPFNAAGDDRIDYLFVKANFYHITHETRLARIYFDSLRVLVDARKKAEPKNGLWRMLLALSYGGLGKRELALREWATFKTPPKFMYRAETYVMLGMQEEALVWLEEGGHRVRGTWVSADPLWAPLRGNPRFEKAVALGK
jgi:serine/threonine-protein kinase